MGLRETKDDVSCAYAAGCNPQTIHTYMHSTSKPLSRPTNTHTHIRTLKLLHIDSSKSVLKIEMCANLCKKQRKQTKAQVKYAASEMRKSKQETKNEHSKY